MILPSTAKHLIFGILLTTPALAETPGATQPQSDAATGVTVFAKADLKPAPKEKATGTVTFLKRSADLKVEIKVANATPGEHGIHIHEKGDCSSPDFKSAGPHYNPHSQHHGAPNQTASHVGDLGNITVKADGTGTIEQDLTTQVYGRQNWNDLIGRAVVLHAKKDDLKSQPAGDSGDRIACGVIQRVELAKSKAR